MADQRNMRAGAVGSVCIIACGVRVHHVELPASIEQFILLLKSTGSIHLGDAWL